MVASFPSPPDRKRLAEATQDAKKPTVTRISLCNHSAEWKVVQMAALRWGEHLAFMPKVAWKVNLRDG